MPLLKFYYFTFLYHFKKIGNESWNPPFRAVLLVELTFAFLLILTGLLLDPSFPYFSSEFFISRLGWWAINIIILVLLYQFLARKSNSDKIYETFISHPWNTRTNRAICWTIWVIVFLAPFVLAAVVKGID